MGDKSPKAKDRARKQGAAKKNQKQATAADKASQFAPQLPKKGK